MSLILYSTDCPKCKVLKQKLNDKNIDFNEVNDVEEMAKKGIEKVPVLGLGDKLMSFVEANQWVNDQPSKPSI